MLRKNVQRNLASLVWVGCVFVAVLMAMLYSIGIKCDAAAVMVTNQCASSAYSQLMYAGIVASIFSAVAYFLLRSGEQSGEPSALDLMTNPKALAEWQDQLDTH